MSCNVSIVAGKESGRSNIYRYEALLDTYVGKLRAEGGGRLVAV